MAEWSPNPLTALLGPTNTGKTHRAVVRMLEHRSGMIGLPLRLLAREVYDRVATQVGQQAVALVTGEEKRIPSHPAYWVCTTEAMPVGLEVDYLAVDEIQLVAHPERGHVFTDRLLHARGRLETWFMGSHTMGPLVTRLLPTVRAETHPRLSTLRHAGRCSLAKLPPRSAVVAFSAPQVYELAGRLRRRKGGAAVVLGALSPRTRNAQVALFQSGEVDYLVATDAIGMGLNLQVDHVAFGALRKFDGQELRPLETAELAQIAGRAGRHLSDGTFGTLEPFAPLPAAIARSLEQHRFPAERQLVWRNSELDTSSLDALLHSLGRRPPRPEFKLVERAVDAEALGYLARRPEIRGQIRHRDEVELLWEVCQIPDFGNTWVEHHCQLLGEVFAELTSARGQLAGDWMAQRIARLDCTEGDLDALLMRIESIRTYTYISHHARWVEKAPEWQARSQAVEDRLSDALHQRLVERFVERGRVASLPSRVICPPAGEHGRGLGALIGWLRETHAPESGTLPWAEQLADARHAELILDRSGMVSWREQPIARLTRGVDLLHPQVKLLETGPLPAGARLLVERRLLAWTRDLLAELVGQLRRPASEALSAVGRGLVYQIEQGLGATSTRAARSQLGALSVADRRVLGSLGVRFGQTAIYLPRSLSGHAAVIRQALAQAYSGGQSPVEEDPPPSMVADPTCPPSHYLALGYVVLGHRAFRIQLAERTGQRLRELGQRTRAAQSAALSRWLACPQVELPALLRAFGYRMGKDGTFARKPPRRRRPRKRSGSARSVSTDAPAGAARSS